jgi:hypothetical protein
LLGGWRADERAGYGQEWIRGEVRRLLELRKNHGRGCREIAWKRRDVGEKRTSEEPRGPAKG